MNPEKINAVVIDLETTGLMKKTDRIIEIGALKIREGEVVDTYQTLLYPGFPLREETVQITGITDDMLRGKRSFSQAADELLAFLEEDVLLGHSIADDYAFLKKAFVDAYPKGFTFDREGIDTLKIARAFLPAEQKKTLSAACSYFGYDFHPHRALDDARATFFLYQKLCGEFAGKSPEAFLPRPLVFAVKKDSPVRARQIEILNDLLKEKNLTAPYPLEQLTRSRASRIIDKLRSGQDDFWT